MAVCVVILPTATFCVISLCFRCFFHRALVLPNCSLLVYLGIILSPRRTFLLCCAGLCDCIRDLVPDGITQCTCILDVEKLRTLSTFYFNVKRTGYTGSVPAAGPKVWNIASELQLESRAHKKCARSVSAVLQCDKPPRLARRRRRYEKYIGVSNSDFFMIFSVA